MTGPAPVPQGNQTEVLLSIEKLVVEYRLGRHGKVQAVSDVSLDIRRGETLGLVGESGCGKTTLGRAAMMLIPPTSGSVRFAGQDLTAAHPRTLRRARRQFQVIFQDPISSLNPRRNVRQIVSEGGRIWRDLGISREKVDALLVAVGLEPNVIGGRHPHELSGGQCQRVAIARALYVKPALLVCDEAVSALDVSVQAQIVNLLELLKVQHNLTVLFIAHDLAVVKHVSDRIAVMYLGKVCEVGPAEAIYRWQAHPYTRALVDSIPTETIDERESPVAITGELPSPLHPPSGCRFRTRCPQQQERCEREEPALTQIGPDGHMAACHFPLADRTFKVSVQGARGSSTPIGRRSPDG